jgi:lactate dehydrogenase-like 2-hydroxyacid dehydrogenase
MSAKHDQRRRLLVVAHIPSSLRQALSKEYVLVDHVLEGAMNEISSLPEGFEAVVTRALFGAPLALLDAQPQLKLVLSLGAGTNKFDMDELARRAITLIHTPDELTEDVADYVIALLYAAQRNIVRADRFVRSGAWSNSRFDYSHRVTERKVGIVGLGRIGGRVAEKLHSLGLEVACLGRPGNNGSGLERFTDIEALATAVDILVLSCAYTASTHHLVKESTLRALGPDGIIINVARGEVIDEHALIEALRNGTIAGAALDVFEGEPTPNPELLRLESVILSPHAASFTYESREAINRRLLEGARDFFAGKRASAT